MSRSHLPDRRGAEIMMFQYDGRPYRVTYGCFRNGDLGEIFLDVGKANAAIQSTPTTPRCWPACCRSTAYRLTRLGDRSQAQSAKLWISGSTRWCGDELGPSGLESGRS